jgi:hypothetical protein
MFATGSIRDPMSVGIDIVHPPHVANRQQRSPLLLSEKTGVFIFAGQSNIANYADQPHTPVNASKVDQINVLDGGCYEALDPLVGASGPWGSWICIFADKLIDADVFDRIILVPIAVGSSSIQNWLPGSLLGNNIAAAYQRCKALNMPVDGVLWQQGESTHVTNPNDYYAPMMTIINHLRSEGCAAPWFLGKSTYSTGDGVTYQTSPGTRAGIDLAVAGDPHVYAGADTDDLIGGTYRSARPGNSLHFTEAGQQATATRWYNAPLSRPLTAED